MFKKTCFKLSFLIVVIVAALGFFVYSWVSNFDLGKIFDSSFVRDQIVDRLGEDNKNLFDLIPEALGFEEPKIYLLLFLNNTEIRPGGGFIGSYATLKVDKGNVEVLAMEGSEKLDERTPEDWKPQPPIPVRDHLGVDRFYFRDSNWSPDFAASSLDTLNLYKAEGGVAADDVDVVIGVTTDVLEDILEITGPIKIDGLEFNSTNAVEVLEYDVEYGYKDRGIAWESRKQVMRPFLDEILKRFKTTIFTKSNQYVTLFTRLAEEKHVMLYPVSEPFATAVDRFNLGGQMPPVPGDYLLWADANLAALKTDHAIERTLNYTIEPHESGRYLATAQMEYKHVGGFDWRTTRYRTYARIFVPRGSELVSSSGSLAWDRTEQVGKISQGEELGRQWFGAFTAIEPGETRVMSFTYLLPKNISEFIEDDLYTLFVQKQLGTDAHVLTLGLNFDKNIKKANPAEEESKWGDSIFSYETDLRIDRSFDINL